MKTISKFKLLFLLPIILLSLNMKTFAQVKTEFASSPRLMHSIGIGAGFTTGYGLSYRYTPSELGFQINFAPYKTKTNEQYSFGVSFLYELIKLKSTALSIYEGNHFLYKRDKAAQIYGGYNIPPYYINPPVYGTVTESHWNNGIGFDLSAYASDNVTFELMAGYAFYADFTEINATIEGAFYFKF